MNKSSDSYLKTNNSNNNLKNDNITDKTEIKNKLINLHQKTTLSPEFDRMVQSVSPFLEYFGLNHFYFSRISYSGYYTTIGIKSELHEFGFDNPERISSWPCIRHPDNLKAGIFIENNCENEDFVNANQDFFKKFKVKFTIRIQRKTNEGLEFIGFGTKLKNNRISENLINEIKLINKFINYFTVKNERLIEIAYENQVNMIPIIGSRFYGSSGKSVLKNG